MNLIDLVTRKDRLLLEVGKNLPIAFTPWLGFTWRSLAIRSSQLPQLSLRHLQRVYSLKSQPLDIGWFACCNDGGSLTVSLKNGSEISESRIELSADPVPVLLPWSGKIGALDASTVLTLHFSIEDNSEARLLIHQKMDRSLLISYALGYGVEIGPGPNPQIKQNHQTSVEYVEESPIEQWIELYDKKGHYKAAEADFSSYKIGTAWSLPQIDHSLDFIFSSHVFEHLANPIGHLLRWKSKLKHNGVILGVVPDCYCTKDYVIAPSSLNELQKEYELGLEKPDEKHYFRWAKARGRVKDVKELMKNNASIHVHFYTPENMTDLLEECVNNYGFESYSVIRRRNHKDFHFILK